MDKAHKQLNNNQNPQANTLRPCSPRVCLGCCRKWSELKETIFSLKGIISLSFNKPYAQRIDPLGNEGMRRSSVSETSIPERWVGNGSHIIDVHFYCPK